MTEKNEEKNYGERYKMLDQKVHKICAKAKERLYKRELCKIEEFEAHHKTREM